MNEFIARRLSPNDIHHVVLNKHNWSPDLEELLKSYAAYDRLTEKFESFQEFIENWSEREMSLWILLEGMGIGIRPVGFEFYVVDQKEEEVQSCD